MQHVKSEHGGGGLERGWRRRRATAGSTPVSEDGRSGVCAGQGAAAGPFGHWEYAGSPPVAAIPQRLGCPPSLLPDCTAHTVLVCSLLATLSPRFTPRRPTLTHQHHSPKPRFPLALLPSACSCILVESCRCFCPCPPSLWPPICLLPPPPSLSALLPTPPSAHPNPARTDYGGWLRWDWNALPLPLPRPLPLRTSVLVVISASGRSRSPSLFRDRSGSSTASSTCTCVQEGTRRASVYG